ncbi:MAG: tRNA-uridine aminocarboxypropyltransferase [Myxococcota bacterium]
MARIPKRRIDWSTLPKCGQCERPERICVCDRTRVLETRLHVLILQHPREQELELSSTPLVLASLPKAVRAVGLSWRSLAEALGEEVDVARWAVLFPLDPSHAPAGTGAKGTSVVLDRQGARVDAHSLEGIVVLDGSWSQGKTLWWRNPWLLKLPRMSLWPLEPSIYGSLRAEPRTQYVSTLESVAQALTATGEDPEIAAQLRRLFRTMVQRARDVLVTVD